MPDTVYTKITLTPSALNTPTINGTVYIEMENDNGYSDINVFNIYQYSQNNFIS